MQVEWQSVLVRLFLYLALMLVFGLPLFAGFALRRNELRSEVARRYIRWSVVACLAGILLSAIGMAVMAKSMTGATAYSELTAHVFEMMVTGTDFGIAWVARLIALSLFITAAITLGKRVALQIAALILTGAVALSTLAWAGHGAMDDGNRRVIHLVVDVVHLLAAGAWIGALAAFSVLGQAARAGTVPVWLLARTGNDFATLGSVIVATLVVTGVANYWLIAGLPSIAVAISPYGILLLVKLVFFTLMMSMAALNRYRLVPRLEAAVDTSNASVATYALNRSLLLEFAIGLLVVTVVAFLGVLSPEG